MRYRRTAAAGVSYFFTAVTHLRRPLLADMEAVGMLHAAIENVRARRPFTLEAQVVLPDHRTRYGRFLTGMTTIQRAGA